MELVRCYSISSYASTVKFEGIHLGGALIMNVTYPRSNRTGSQFRKSAIRAIGRYQPHVSSKSASPTIDAINRVSSYAIKPAVN